MRLLGRGMEGTRVEELLIAARRGQSGVLVIRGEPGMGKTALCRRAMGQAGDMVVLSARGSAAEAAMPFCALSDILAVTRPHWDALAPEQVQALVATVTAQPASGPDRFATYAAALAALAATAEHRALLIVVDDVPWVDSSSAEALTFIARRLEAEGIAMLLTARTGSRSAIDTAEFPELNLEALVAADVATLLIEHGLAVTPAVSERLTEEAGGNPLAIIECVRLLTGEQREGRDRLPSPLPIGRSLEQVYEPRIAALPSACSAALTVVAASDNGAAADVMPALRELGLESSLELAENDELITIARGSIGFCHPLIRSAAYQAATPAERRRAHAALARAAGDPFRRAWHLGEATIGPDEVVAGALVDAGAAARLGGDPGVAVAMLTRAAELSVDPDVRGDRLLAAATAAMEAGQIDVTRALTEQALASTSDPHLRASLQLVRGRAELVGGVPLSIHAQLVEEADRIAGIAPEEAALLLADAAWGCTMAGRMRLARREADRANLLAADAPPHVQAIAGGQLGQVLILGGDVSRGRQLLLGNEEALVAMRHPLSAFIAVGLTLAEDFEGARARVEGMIAMARAMRAPGLLPYALDVLADLDYRVGRWSEAYVGASEATRLAEATGQKNVELYSLTWQARIEAVTGRDELCRAHAETVLQRCAGIESVADFSNLAIGMLELGRGRPETAIAAFECVEGWQQTHGHADHAMTPWFPDLVEALVQSGRRDDAARVVAGVAGDIEADDRAWPRAVLARARGLLATDDEHMEAAFATALHWHDRTPTPFEEARTQLCLGTRRRRTGRRRDAREPLRAARATFARLGASPWLDKATRELAATGEHTLGRRAPATSTLTSQELQVAMVVGQGLSNREAASALFLSPKTIEAHLGRVFAKLQLRSRAQLARLMAEREASTN